MVQLQEGIFGKVTVLLHLLSPKMITLRRDFFLGGIFSREFPKGSELQAAPWTCQRRNSLYSGYQLC